AENNVVSRACIDGGPGLQPAGTGNPVTLTIPITACALHGPDTPPTKPGEPPLRARDADVTGGYYQPVSVRAGGQQAIALERLRRGGSGRRGQQLVGGANHPRAGASVGRLARQPGRNGRGRVPAHRPVSRPPPRRHTVLAQTSPDARSRWRSIASREDHDAT